MKGEGERQFIITDDGVAPRARLLLPVYPVRGAITIIDGEGNTLDPAHYILDATLGIVRWNHDRSFTRYPYTVTVSESAEA